ncbi:putative serine/threonine/dual specificity protein kinase, catalytic domain-containing protein [Tanacetum coccineum]
MDQPCTHVSTDVKGSFGYFDLNYFLTRRLTRTSDVYSFGVVLSEVLCGRPAVDPSLGDDELGLLDGPKFVEIAIKCLQTRPKDPPTMSEVVVELEAALALHKRGDYLDHPNSPKVRRLKVLGSTQIEVKLLIRLNHLNLVNLLGYCSEDKELLLIYEFMEKGDLDSYILKRKRIL